jgi:hypothetical protein
MGSEKKSFITMLKFFVNSCSDIGGLWLIAPDCEADFIRSGGIDTFRFCELFINGLSLLDVALLN